MRASGLLQMLLLMFWLPGPVGLAQAQTVVRFQTTFGDIDVELFDATTPLTVANFLSYVDDRDYRRSFIHRSVGLPNVIQGGGFVFEDFFQFVPTDPPVPLELGHGNLSGTLAMARLGGQPDSATSQWYFNVSDNAFLDTSDGGFAVFGEVLDGLDVVDTIRALPVFNASGIHPTLVTLPLHDFVMNPLIPVDHLVFVYRILRVADFQCGDVNDDWVVDDLDPTLLRANLADPSSSPISGPGARKVRHDRRTGGVRRAGPGGPAPRARGLLARDRAGLSGCALVGRRWGQPWVHR